MASPMVSELNEDSVLLESTTSSLSDTSPFDAGSIYLKIIIGTFLVLVILISIFGNLLICVAIASDRRLRRLGNLFIVSLAIADLCVASLVMTFALANDLMDYWPFAPQLCELWISFDISCSTCSIINLCAIALDRFVHIKDPMRYNRWMNKRIVISCVSVIWLVSCMISFVPISLGWHRPAPLPAEKYSTSSTEWFANLSAYPMPENQTLPIITSELLLPQSIINSSTDTLPSYSVQQVMLNIASEKHLRHNPSLSPLSHHHVSRHNHNHFNQNKVLEQRLFMYRALALKEQEPTITQCSLDLTPTYAVVSSMISFYLPCIFMLYLYAKLYAICQQHVKCIKSMTKPFVPNHYQMSSTNNSANNTDRCNSFNSKKNVPVRVEGSISAVPAANAYNSTQQSQVTEHKAAITLGIIMGTFLACWMPFFCMNIVAAFCKDCISQMTFKIITWLGYFNSCLNPAIYSIFNTEFRDAFKRILVRYLFRGDVSGSSCNTLFSCNKRTSRTMMDHNPVVASVDHSLASHNNRNSIQIPSSSWQSDSPAPDSASIRRKSSHSSIMFDITADSRNNPAQIIDSDSSDPSPSATVNIKSNGKPTKSIPSDGTFEESKVELCKRNSVHESNWNTITYTKEAINDSNDYCHDYCDGPVCPVDLQSVTYETDHSSDNSTTAAAAVPKCAVPNLIKFHQRANQEKQQLAASLSNNAGCDQKMLTDNNSVGQNKSIQKKFAIYTKGSNKFNSFELSTNTEYQSNKFPTEKISEI